jgi:hypothetical protein
VGVKVHVDVAAILLCPDIHSHANTRVVLFSHHRLDFFNHPRPSVFYHYLGWRGRCRGSCGYRGRGLLTAGHSQ